MPRKFTFCQLISIFKLYPFWTPIIFQIRVLTLSLEMYLYIYQHVEVLILKGIILIFSVVLVGLFYSLKLLAYYKGNRVLLWEDFIIQFTNFFLKHWSIPWNYLISLFKHIHMQRLMYHPWPSCAAVQLIELEPCVDQVHSVVQLGLWPSVILVPRRSRGGTSFLLLHKT